MNYYSEAIELLEALRFMPSENVRKILVEITRKHPKHIIQAASLAGVIDGFKAEAKALRDDGKKIAAIKLWRSKTGASLKDAKEAVDSL